GSIPFLKLCLQRHFVYPRPHSKSTTVISKLLWQDHGEILRSHDVPVTMAPVRLHYPNPISGSERMSQYRYKQTLLLLAILILPSVAIGLLGWRDFTREREKQLRDAEERTKIDIRQTLLQVLERIKLQEISGAPSDPAVVLVLRWRQTGLNYRG